LANVRNPLEKCDQVGVGRALVLEKKRKMEEVFWKKNPRFWEREFEVKRKLQLLKHRGVDVKFGQ
jgi:hypothetical protein